MRQTQVLTWWMAWTQAAQALASAALAELPQLLALLLKLKRQALAQRLTPKLQLDRLALPWLQLVKLALPWMPKQSSLQATPWM